MPWKRLRRAGGGNRDALPLAAGALFRAGGYQGEGLCVLTRQRPSNWLPEALPSGPYIQVLAGNMAKRGEGLSWLHSIPYFRRFVTEGGLISFGIDQAALYRLAASYVDRILKGEKPADLPVQAPTKYETVLNITTAKALGLEVPPSVFARADEVIE